VVSIGSFKENMGQLIDIVSGIYISRPSENRFGVYKQGYSFGNKIASVGL
jgi:hypothetical protein